MKKGALCAAALFAGLSLSPVAASASTIIGGGTSVELTATSTFQSLGLGVATYGTASATMNGSNIVANFLITGGSKNDSTGALLVQHNGSGLNFSSGTDMLSIGNFEIDTDAGTVMGIASANGTDLGIVPLFTLGANSTLLLTWEAAGAFTSVFGAPDLTGANIGTATITAVTAGAVPEPASWGLMIGGFAFAGAALRRRSAQATRLAAAA
ncbi:PEPxxWA-CTERM sorting domain-containing protein [Sphingomonas sp. RS6]